MEVSENVRRSAPRVEIESAKADFVML